MLLVCFDIQVKDKENEKIENCKDLKRDSETDLEIAQSNCGANHNWCIRNCLERYKKAVNTDWCHMSFGIIWITLKS